MKLSDLAALASLAIPSSTVPKPQGGEEIHLQWAICDADPSTVLAKLGYPADRPAYKQFPISYYDTEPPSHTAQGVMFRTKFKKIHHVPHPLSLVKVRFEGSDIPQDKEVPGADECVWDRYGDHVFFTCAQPSFLDGYGQSQSIIGDEGQDHELPTADLWSDEQMGFTEQFRNVTWEDLAAYGPFQNPKWKVKIAGRKGKFDSVIAEGEGLGGKVVHLMEIEVPAEKEGSDEVYRDIDEHLRSRGVVLCDEQIGKTGRLFEAMRLSSAGQEDGGEL